MSKRTRRQRQQAIQFTKAPQQSLARLSEDSQAVRDTILGTIGRLQGRTWPNLSQYHNQAVLYTRSPWVYVAASKIARTAALVGINAVRLIGERREQIENHPVEVLLRRPNPWQSQFELIEQTIGFKELNGNAYWFLSGSAGGQPEEIYILRPDRMRIVAGGTTNAFISGYVYSIDGIDIPLEPDEVIHFKTFHPLSDYYGLSPLESIALAVQTDLSMAEWNRNFYGQEMAIPAGVVNIKTPISDLEFERIKEQWRESYGSRQRRTAFLKDAEIGYQDIGINHKDMDFLSGRQFSKEEIMLAYGVPPGMLDKNATEANAQAGQEFFTSYTIWPRMVEFCQKLTSDLVPFWGRDLAIEPEDIRIKDTKAEQAEITAFSPYLTINEIRERYLKADPVEWGDIPAVGAGAVAITGQSIPSLMSRTGLKPDEVRETPADAQARQEVLQAQASSDNQKALIGQVQDCYVILSLAGDPALMGIQANLRQQYPYVDWVDPADFHITLVYAEQVSDLQAVRSALPRSIQPVALEVGPLGHFESDQSIPIFLDVARALPLVALQNSLVGAFQALGLSLSPYSDPVRWHPHVTLGYMLPGQPLPVWDDRAGVTATSIEACTSVLDRFESLYVTKNVPAVPPLSRGARRELARFGTFAAKRLGTPRAAEIDGFTFHDTPAGAVLAAKALARSRETASLLMDITDHMAEHYPIEQRDTAQDLTAVAIHFLEDFRTAVLKMVMLDHHMGAAFRSAWRDRAYADFVSRAWVGVNRAAKAAGEVLEMSHGVTLGYTLLSDEANQYAAGQWADNSLDTWLDGLFEGIDSLLAQSKNHRGVLIDAVASTPLLAEANARQFAVREAARLQAVGTALAARATARELALPFHASIDSASEGASKALYIEPYVSANGVSLRWKPYTSSKAHEHKPRGSALPPTEAQRVEPFTAHEIDGYFAEFERITHGRHGS